MAYGPEQGLRLVDDLIAAGSPEGYYFEGYYLLDARRQSCCGASDAPVRCRRPTNVP
jgi:hypothetical protein